MPPQQNIVINNADEIFAELDAEIAGSIAAEHGTPVYLISELALRARIRAMLSAVTAYPTTRISWSLKTNPLKGVLAIMRSEGLWLEVVSDYEYALVRDAGVPDHEIVFNGPARSDDALVSALRGGAIVNLDRPEELDRLIALGSQVGKSARVGLRVDIEGRRRFGFSLPRGEVHEAVRRLASAPHLSFGGLHNQLGANIRDMDRFRAFADCFAGLAREFGAPLPWIDVGGSLAGTNPRREETVRRHPWIAPETYCEAMLSPLVGAAELLILEPGRSLIEPTGALLTRVVGVRSTHDGGRAYVLNGGLNAVESAVRRRHPIRALVDPAREEQPASLFGPLCIGQDRMAEDIPLPELRRGDLVLIEGVGAYDIPRGITFIEPRPGVLCWRGGTEVHWMCRPETREHIQALEV